MSNIFEIFSTLRCHSHSVYARERWILGCLIVGDAARMASKAGNDEMILFYTG
jgi:hypothetical protein